MGHKPKAPLRPVDRIALRPAEGVDALGLSERSLGQLLSASLVSGLEGVAVLPVEPTRRWLAEHADRRAGHRRLRAFLALSPLGQMAVAGLDSRGRLR
jgi:hypothetical protein